MYPGGNSSLIGRNATNKPSEPSMWLCVHGKEDTRSKYNVLHETGHALGLFHEHQHPDAVDIYDREAVIKDIKDLKGKSEIEAEEYYKKNFEKSEKRDEDEDEKKYDPDSVMRYK